MSLPIVDAYWRRKYTNRKAASSFFFHVRSTDTELCELPAQWLQTLLEDLTSDSPSEALCGTRRSAGVPFFIQVSSVITLIVSLTCSKIITESPFSGLVSLAAC